VANAFALQITPPVQISGPRIGTDLSSGRPAIAASRSNILLVWANRDSAILDHDGRRLFTAKLDGPPIATDSRRSSPALASDGSDFLVAYGTSEASAQSGAALHVIRVDSRGGSRALGIVSEHYMSGISAIHLTWTGSAYLLIFATDASVRTILIGPDGTLLRHDETIADSGADAVGSACDPSACRVVFSHQNTISVLRLDQTGHVVGRDSSVVGSNPGLAWDGSRYVMAFTHTGATGLVVAAVDDSGTFDLATFPKAILFSNPPLASDGAGTIFVTWDEVPWPRMTATFRHIFRIHAGATVEMDTRSENFTSSCMIAWDGEHFLVTDDDGAVHAYGSDYGAKQLWFASPLPLSPPCRVQASSAAIDRVTLISYRECDSWTDDGRGRLIHAESTKRVTILSPFHSEREIALGADVALGATVAGRTTFLVVGKSFDHGVTAMRFSSIGEPLSYARVLTRESSNAFAVWDGTAFIIAFGASQVRLTESGEPEKPAAIPDTDYVVAIASNGQSHLLVTMGRDGAHADVYASDGNRISHTSVGPLGPEATAASNGNEYVIVRHIGDSIEGWRLDRNGALLNHREIVRANNLERVVSWDGYHYLLVWSDSVQVMVKTLTSELDAVGDVQRFVEGTFRLGLSLSTEERGVTRFLSQCLTICSQFAIEQPERRRASAH
jgi:hypothetical protein